MTGDVHQRCAIKVNDNIWRSCCGLHHRANHVSRDDEMDRLEAGKFQFGPRPCDIRWGSCILPGLLRLERLYPHFCIVQFNNVFNTSQMLAKNAWLLTLNPRSISSRSTARLASWLIRRALPWIIYEVNAIFDPRIPRSGGRRSQRDRQEEMELAEKTPGVHPINGDSRHDDI